MIQREFQVKFGCRKASNRSAINRSVNKYEMTGHMTRNKEDVVSKKKPTRIPENIHHVEQALTQGPRKSATSFSATQLGSTINI
jgi:hypothetical protein